MRWCATIRAAPGVAHGTCEARHYTQLAADVVQCLLCPKGCHIAPGKLGACRTRRNEDGRLVYLYYGACASLALDPVEKKPLYHFCPGHTLLSYGSLGCNLGCLFCQNWEIAQTTVPTEYLSPEELARLAKERAVAGCVGVAFTYNEPLVGFEYVLDAARAVRAAGLRNVLVTNGEIEEEPLRELLPYIDACNIDVKGFTEEFYRSLCRGRLAPVLRTVALTTERVHVELTNLLIPGRNDSTEAVEALVDWATATCGPNVPLHFSRYFPNYQFDLAPTPLASLQRAKEIANRKLHYVYLGNVDARHDADTFCPACGSVIIVRHGYQVEVLLNGRACPQCGEIIPVVLPG